jgi:hypothetical protein
MTIFAAVADFGGRRYFCSKSRPLSSIQFIAGVVDTGKQFIAGVNDIFPSVIDTGQK